MYLLHTADPCEAGVGIRYGGIVYPKTEGLLLWSTKIIKGDSLGRFLEFPSTLGYTSAPHWKTPLIRLRSLNLQIFCKKGQKAVYYIEN
jgi:hypothetical protein